MGTNPQLAKNKQLSEFELGRLFERREVRDQLLFIAKLNDENQRKEILWAWLVDTMDNLPDQPFTIEIEETYVIFEP